MTGEGIRQAIIDIIREIVPDEDLSGIDAEKPLRDQIDLDSMDFLDIVMELRKRYSVEVPEQDYQELATMSSTVNYLLPKMEGL
ncbi:Acyl carrier protein [hydrothermal vent metagenome]|uniref:Acyl carrier protein n=1 Tax=hydrothermal vent metagenome TaxID=652676 RepID=A0A3B1BZY7_9ZZZZ